MPYLLVEKSDQVVFRINDISNYTVGYANLVIYITLFSVLVVKRAWKQFGKSCQTRMTMQVLSYSKR